MREIIDLKVAMHGGYSFTLDNCSQIIEQLSIVNENLNSSLLLRSVKSSVILMSFNMLEGYANFLSSLALGLNNEEINGPEIKKKLDIIEQDILKEEVSKYDFQKCIVKSQKNSYVATLDKVKVVLTLLSKIYGKEYKLKISENEWKNIKDLKKERDKLTHPKFSMNNLPSMESDEYLKDINKLNPTFDIDDKVLIEGIIGLRWYFHQSALVLQDLFREDMSRNLLWGLDLLLYKLILELNKMLNVFKSESEFKKKVVDFRDYQTDYYDHTERGLYFFTKRDFSDDL